MGSNIYIIYINIYSDIIFWIRCNGNCRCNSIYSCTKISSCWRGLCRCRRRRHSVDFNFFGRTKCFSNSLNYSESIMLSHLFLTSQNFQLYRHIWNDLEKIHVFQFATFMVMSVMLSVCMIDWDLNLLHFSEDFMKIG